jgi:hypothetical protein
MEVVSLSLRKNGNEIAELLKTLHRMVLDPLASRDILNKLRHLSLDKRNDRLKSRNAITLLLTAFSVAVVLAFFFSPFVIDQAQRLAAIAGMDRTNPRTAATALEQPSPIFQLGIQRVRGIEGKLGYMEPYDIVANSYETVSKIFWYAWGDPEKLSSASLTATAFNLSTGQKFTVNQTTLQGPFNGADAHAVTHFTPFPSKGLWKMDISLNGEPYASIVVPVKDEYVHTEHTRFLLSKDDVVAGENPTTLVVPGHNQPTQLELKITSMNDKSNVHVVTFSRGGEFIQAKPITQYTGTLQFEGPGPWKVEVLGETTDVNLANKLSNQLGHKEQ